MNAHHIVSAFVTLALATGVSPVWARQDPAPVRDGPVSITALGGAGSLKDIAALIARFGVIGAAAGSMFVFKGAFRAVLISYPAPEDKDHMIREAARA